MRITSLSILLLATGFLLHQCNPNAHASERVDANIVTGLDMSGSIEDYEMRLQFDGIALAMQSEDVQQAIRHGRHKKIGFAVYIWSNNGCPVVIDWMMITNADDAAQMVAGLQARMDEARTQLGRWGLTDTSSAMLCGADLLKTSPFLADRQVLNIVTNGDDNVENGEAKPVLEAAGINVNAVAMPGGTAMEALLPFLQEHVLTGPVPFLIQVDKPEGLTDAWRRKFVGDMV